MGGERLRFDQFELDPQTLELWQDGEPVPLRPQPAQILLLLARRAGELVSREELRDHIWGEDVSVDFEHSLNSAVRQVRAALGERAGDSRLLQTFPRRGYRLSASVTVIDPDAPSAPEAEPVAEAPAAERAMAAGRGLGRLGWGAVAVLAAAVLVIGWFGSREAETPDSAAAPSVLAILPFTALSGQEQDRLIGEGLSQELIGELGRLHAPRLALIAPGSAGRAGNEDAVSVARRLGAGLVLHGTLRTSGGEVRVTAQLVDVADGRQLWAGMFDGQVQYAFELQRRISTSIVSELVEELSLPAPGGTHAAAVSSPAYAAFLGGRARYARGAGPDLVDAVARFREAVELDPDLAIAWAYLARALIDAPLDTPPAERGVPEAIDRALELDPSLAGTYLARSRWRMWQEWDIAGALRDVDRAAEQEPGTADVRAARAGVLVALGRHDEAGVEMRRALLLDPLSPTLRADAAWYQYMAGRWPEAMAEARLGIDLEQHLVRAWHVLLYAAIASGDAEVQREVMLHRLTDIEPNVDTAELAASSLVDLTQRFWDRYLPWLAENNVAGTPPPESMVPGLIITGRHSEAMAALSLAADRRSSRMLPYLRVLPFLDPLRGMPEFAVLDARFTWPEDLVRP